MMRLLIVIGVMSIAPEVNTEVAGDGNYATTEWCDYVTRRGLCYVYKALCERACAGFPCNPNRCRNGGACLQRAAGYYCNCRAGYIGHNCEKGFPCNPNRCRNGGACLQRAAGYYCNCRAGYIGHNCEKVCFWGPWTGSDCDVNGQGGYAIVRTRVKIEEQGGRECGGQETSVKTCIVNSEVASALFQSISEVKTARSPSVIKETEESSEKKCSTNEHFGQGGVTIAGRQCGEPTLKLIQNSAEEKLPHRDILFMVDESGSIGEVNFKKEMKLVLTLISQFCGKISIAHDQTRAGLMTFDKVPHVHIPFNRYLTQAELYQKASEIKYSKTSAGATCLVDALKYAREEMFTQKFGARPDVDRMIILITDGCANCNDPEIEEIAKDLEKDNISIITYIINNTDDCWQTSKIRVFIDGSRCSQFFRTTWNNFIDIADKLSKMLCLAKWTAAGGSSC